MRASFSLFTCLALGLTIISLPVHSQAKDDVLSREVVPPGYLPPLHGSEPPKMAKIKVFLESAGDGVSLEMPREDIKTVAGSMRDSATIIFPRRSLPYFQKMFEKFGSFKYQLEKFGIKPFTKDMGRIVSKKIEAREIRIDRIYDFTIQISEKGDAYLIMEDRGGVLSLSDPVSDPGSVSIYSEQEVSFFVQMMKQVYDMETEKSMKK